VVGAVLAGPACPGSIRATHLRARRPAALDAPGSERAKLGLAMLPAGETNPLLLDEPTNNLDPSSNAAVGAILGAWPRAIVAASHERGYVEPLRPTYCLRLPKECSTHWREEHLDDVEMR
jgi:ATPase subunit of ABC transporter with duplicated ATPase domains